jgi:hypothetical protein
VGKNIMKGEIIGKREESEEKNVILLVSTQEKE